MLGWCEPSDDRRGAVVKGILKALAVVALATYEVLSVLWSKKVPPGQAATLTIVPGMPEERTDDKNWTPYERQLMLVLTDTQKVTLRLEPRNAKGNLAPVDGVPQWAVSNPGVGHISVDADGLGATFFADTGGDTQVSATADADMGSGVRQITATLDISVRPGEAVTLGITAGTPAEQ